METVANCASRINKAYQLHRCKPSATAAASPASPAVCWGSHFPHTLVNTTSCLDCSHPSGCVTCGLIGILPVSNVVEQDDLFTCLLAICTSSLENCLIRLFADLKVGSSFYYWVVRVLYSRYKFLIRYMYDLRIRSLFCKFVFSLSWASLVHKVEFWFPEFSTKFSKCLKLWSSLKFFESRTRLWDVTENGNR